MPRPQFTLKTLFWTVLVVVAAFGGMAWQRGNDQKELQRFKVLIKEQNDFTSRLQGERHSLATELARVQRERDALAESANSK